MALTENHWDQMYVDQSAEEPTGNPDPGPIPNELLQVPGFVNDVIDYTLATAPYPERSLAFCGAIGLQSLLAGRKGAQRVRQPHKSVHPRLGEFRRGKGLPTKGEPEDSARGRHA